MNCSFNKYSQVAARALRQSLKESERVKAEKRGFTELRYQKWENGQGGEQVQRVFVRMPIFLTHSECRSTSIPKPIKDQPKPGVPPSDVFKPIAVWIT